MVLSNFLRQILNHLRKFMQLECQKGAASKMHKCLAEIIFMTIYSQMCKFYISKEINFMKRCIFKILIESELERNYII